MAVPGGEEGLGGGGSFRVNLLHFSHSVQLDVECQFCLPVRLTLVDIHFSSTVLHNNHNNHSHHSHHNHHNHNHNHNEPRQPQQQPQQPNNHKNPTTTTTTTTTASSSSKRLQQLITELVGVQETPEVQVARDPAGDQPQQRRVPEQVIAHDILESPAPLLSAPRNKLWTHAQAILWNRSPIFPYLQEVELPAPQPPRFVELFSTRVRTCCRTRSRPRGSPVRLSTVRRELVWPDPAQQRDCWWLAVADGSWECTIVWRTSFGDSDGRMATWFLDNACSHHVPQLQFMVTLFYDLLSALNLVPL